jgi:amino acid transporter
MGGLSPLAFLLCAVGLAPVALCYAEAAGRTDRSGGPYVYAREAFGPWSGFVIGWLCYANSVFALAAVALVAAANLGRFSTVFASPAAARTVGIGLICAFGALNYVGTKPSARVTDLFTVGKLVALFVLVAAALPAIVPARFAAPPPHGLAGIGAATFISVFAVQGFEVVPVPAGEAARPSRNVPIGILFALAVSSVIYVIVQAAVVGTHPRLSAPTDTPLADAALAVAPTLGLVVSLGGLISIVGYIAGNALGAPRYAFAAAEDGYLPRALAFVHPRFQTPSRAIVFTCLLSSALVWASDYRRLIGLSNLTVAAQYLATCAAVPVLRRRGPSTAFAAPGGLLVPLVGIAVSLWIFTEGSSAELAYAAGALVVGVVLAALSRRLGR